MPRRVLSIVALLALLCPAVAPGAGKVRFFGRHEGLPGNRVLCLFQDADGALWAGTDGGAARYDGRRWRAYTVRDGLAGPEVHGIVQDASGSLWFATSGGVCRYNGLFWDRLGWPDGLQRSRRAAALLDAAGTLWFTPGGTLHRWDPSRSELARLEGVPVSPLTSLFADDGDLGVTAEDGAAVRAGGRWVVFGKADGLPVPVRGGLRDSRDILWLATPGGLAEKSGSGFRLYGRSAGLPSDDVRCVAEDRAGRIWAGTGEGPAFWDGWSWNVPAGTEGLPERTVESLLVDRGGNLWLGTSSGVGFLDLSWETVADEEGSPPAHPFLRMADGSLVHASGEGLVIRRGRIAERLGAREGLEGRPLTLLEGSDGLLWVGTDRGLHRFDGRRFRQYLPPQATSAPVQVGEGLWVNRTTREPTVREGLTGDRVSALMEDRDGRLWVGTEGGLSILDEERWTLFEGVAGLGAGVAALAASDGGVWVGTGKGLLRFDGTSWHDAVAGAPRDAAVTALLPGEGDHLWVGTGDGLWFLEEGRWTRLRQEDGLLSDRVTSLARDEAGVLWVGTMAGAALYDGAEWSSLTSADGLPSPEVLSVAPLPGGVVALAGTSCLALHRPDRVPPETVIKNPPTGPVGSPQYLFEFDGADLVTEPYDLQWSWRLDGDVWSPFSREPLVTVSDLANGRHVFEVRALDRGLNADPTPAVVSFEVNTALFDVEVVSLEVPDLFASLYRHYARDPGPEGSAGRIVLRNRYDRPLKVKVGLQVPRFMDFSTDRVASLPPGEEVTLPLRLELDERVLALRENSPEQLLVSLQYHLQGELKENRFSRGVNLLGRNAMVWDDPRVIAVWVSHLDPDVESLARRTVARARPLEDDYVVDNNVIRAACLFDLLGAAGIRYLPDPDHPYTGPSSGKRSLDFIRYPRETLALGSGDCDDLAVLYAALLQAVGIDTALVDVGDHVFLMFDTGLIGEERRLVSPDSSRTHLDAEGRVWVPVETTLAGSTFSAAWSRGMEEMAREPRQVIPLKDAWKLYQPVAGGAEVPLPAALAATDFLPRAVDDLGAVEDALLGSPLSDLRRRASGDPRNPAVLNTMGILLGRKGYYARSRLLFREVVGLVPGFAGGWSNLANVLYEQGEYTAAIDAYRRALDLDPANAQTHVELALTYAETGDFSRAREHYRRAVELVPELGAAGP